ncbi:tyrosine-type recombinase/integrase, partial [Candidatus Peregrinibacteria bacterium]|nr:tyrosine-type recombinase/integrase [Candidatus Peregrinibacteria bacterium]
TLPSREKITLEEFEPTVWDWDSEYVKGQKARGKQIGHTYVKIMHGYMKSHVLPDLGTKRISKLTRRDIEQWQIMKLNEGKIKAKTINSATTALRVVLREAVNAGIRKDNPASGIGKLTEKAEKRGALSREEAKKVLNPKQWKRFDMWVLNLTAATTGIRMGALQGLTVGAVFPGYIDIQQAWERTKNFKEPKWGSCRKVPIGGMVFSALAEQIARLPNRHPNALVFPGSIAGQPVNNKTILEHLKKAMVKAGISEKDRTSRGLSFHSWRHFATTQLRKAGINDAQVKAITGHKTASMLDIYGAHFRPEDFKGAVKILEEGILKK